MQGVTAEEVASALTNWGVKFDREKDSAGDPAMLCRFELPRIGIDRLIKFQILFYDKVDGAERYSTIQFHCGFGGVANLLLMNEFNRRFRFGRAYLKKNGNPAVEMDCVCEGDPTAYLPLYLKKWEKVVEAII